MTALAVALAALAATLAVVAVWLWQRLEPLVYAQDGLRARIGLLRMQRDRERQYRERAERQAYEIRVHRDELWRAARALLAAHDRAHDVCSDSARSDGEAVDALADEGDARERLRAATEGDRP